MPYVIRLHKWLRSSELMFHTESQSYYIPFMTVGSSDLSPEDWNDMDAVAFTRRVLFGATERVFAETNFNCIVKENNEAFEAFVTRDEARDARFRIRGIALGEVILSWLGMCF